jgi:hypothetical protein
MVTCILILKAWKILSIKLKMGLLCPAPSPHGERFSETDLLTYTDIAEV